MLKDRNQTKTIIKTLRQFAKSGTTITFREDRDFPLSFISEMGNNNVVLNSVFLYRRKEKKK